ncbi:MAG: hypothetical protein AAF806_02865 [Bacteroidota bacterium]
MKRFFYIFLLFFFTVQGLATRCADYGISVYPDGGHLTPESMILVEGKIISQRVIDSLNITYPIYLVSKSEQVELEIVEKCKGQSGFRQALLKPVRKLKIGKKYELKIENLKEFETYDIYKKRDAKILGKTWPSWQIDSYLDRKVPYWEHKPEFIYNESTRYGCGDSDYLIFNMRFSDEYPVLIKTEVMNLDTQKSQIYYLSMEKYGQIKVGHGMCGGAFFFEKETKYQVRFRLMDLTGNLNKERTEWSIVTK